MPWYTVDITGRKEAEEALKEGEDRHRRQLGELALLHGVCTALAQELDLRRVLRGAVEAVAKTYGYTQVGAYLLEGADLVLQHLVGYEHVIERFPVTKGVRGCAVRRGTPILVEDVRRDLDISRDQRGRDVGDLRPALPAPAPLPQARGHSGPLRRR